MAPQLIGPLPSDPPAGGQLLHGGARELPSDILNEASARLGTFSLVVGVLWALGTTFGHVAERAMMRRPDPRGMHFEVTDLIALASIAASVALFVYTRRGKREAQFVLDLGLGYMVLMALALGLMFHWDGAPSPDALYPQISWVGVMLLMFAAILPTSAPKLIAASVFAVAMNPIGMLISHARGGCELCTASNALLMHWPDVLLIGVAVVIARVVVRLGRQVGRARDMGSYELT